MNDPLTSITQQLACDPRSPNYSTPPIPPSSSAHSEIDARVFRESSERLRALDLIRRKKRKIEESEVSNVVRSGFDSQYNDMFNRKLVEEAHRGRERRWGYHHNGRGGGIP